MHHLSKKLLHNGNTLIETLLYVAVFSLMLAGVSSVYLSAAQSRNRTQSISEVEQQGAFAGRIILQSLRNATAVNTPALGGSSATLSVNTSTPATTPTVFSLSSGRLQVTEGAGSSVFLTGGRVTVSNLIFYNYGNSGTLGSVRYEFTVSSNAGGGRTDYNYQKTFYGAASIRP